ncbi:DUF6777 domain-containing protein [Streptomyces sp. SAI-170]|uniref:DUF6777 domain-containing protein n=1 Tax=Streptomyces sp. SAI-170 TaxID=3377729 RepID=UPI003C7D9183
MRSPIRTLVAAVALTTALLATGCAVELAQSAGAGEEVLLQPVAAQGPDPFTGSTDASGAGPDTRASRPAEPPSRPRSVSGATPGLYGGMERAGSCDVPRQIEYLTADPARARAFADVEGITPQAVPGYLRGLTPVVLRADTQVTNHGYRDGRATAFPSVLQSGTAVLVDTRGVPRVRCACGNPLLPPTATDRAPATKGSAWSGYRPSQVVVVTPAPEVITHITIIDVVDHTWIERRCGHDTRHDRPVRPPAWATTRPPTPSELESASRSPRPSTPAPATPSTSSPGTHDEFAPPDASEPGRPLPPSPPSGCVTPTVTVTPGSTGLATVPPTPGDCPAATLTATPPSLPSLPNPPSRPSSPGTQTAPRTPSEDVGPETVPDSPDLPDSGGLIPDDVPDDTAGTRSGTAESIFGSPTDVFAG